MPYKFMNKRKWVASAFESKSGTGSSLNKWLSFWCMILISFLHIKYLNAELKNKGDFDLIPQFLWCDFTGCALFLGIIHATDIIEFLNRNKGYNQIGGQVDTSCIKQSEEQVLKKSDD